MATFNDFRKKYFIINLIKRFKFNSINKKIITNYISEGAEGIVYNYGKNKIIKFIPLDNRTHEKYFLKLFKELTKLKLKEYVPIYKYGIINSEKNKTHDIEIGAVAFYITEKLYKVNWTSFLKIEDVWIDNKLPLLRKKYKLDYRDFHYDNVMKNKRGVVKIIDLTGFEILK